MRITRTDKAFQWHINNGFLYPLSYKSFYMMKDTGIYIYYKCEDSLPKDILYKVENKLIDYWTFTKLMQRYEMSCYKKTYYDGLFEKVYEYICNHEIKKQEVQFLWFCFKEEIPEERFEKHIGKGYDGWDLFKIQRGLFAGLSDEDIQKYLIEDKDGSTKYLKLNDLDYYCNRLETKKREEEIQVTKDLVTVLNIPNKETVVEERDLKQKQLSEELYPNLIPVEYKPKLHIIIPLILVPAISFYYISKIRSRSNG